MNKQGVTISVISAIKGGLYPFVNMENLADGSKLYVYDKAVQIKAEAENEINRLLNLPHYKLNDDIKEKNYRIVESLKSVMIFLPEDIKNRLYVVNSVAELFIREAVWVASSESATRIQHTIYNHFESNISEDCVWQSPFIYYAGTSEEYDTFTFNMSYAGLISLKENIISDYIDSEKKDWSKISVLTDELNRAFDRIKIAICNDYSDIFLYDNNISLYQASCIMVEVSNLQTAHQSGYVILKGYMDSLEDAVEKVDIVIGNDIISGWYMNHVLIIFDSYSYYSDIYTFDPAKDESIFIVKISDAQNRRVNIIESDYKASVEFGSSILDDIIKVIASRYEYYHNAKFNSNMFTMDTPNE